jgi:inhibitor of KinA sporulation pathway (predicted exonuclease)
LIGKKGGAAVTILAIDFETTGTDPKNCYPIEVACAKVYPDTFTLSDTFEKLMWDRKYPSLTPEVVRVTHIQEHMLEEGGCDPAAVLTKVAELVDASEGCLAYNASFDRGVFEASCRRLGLKFPVRPWVCALKDVPYPEHYTCRKMSHLALDHGITVYPGKLHRALGDVELMLELLRVSGYKWEDMLRRSMEPVVFLQALIPPPWEDNGIGKAKAKEAGYSFETPRGFEVKFPRLWVKAVRLSDVSKEFERQAFKVKELRRGKA